MAGTQMITDGCEACGMTLPLPALICFDCSEGIDTHGNPLLSQYCTVRCRRDDLQIHREDCQARNTRKQIYRAGELLQAAHFHLVDRTYDYRIKSTDTKSGVLYYHVVDTAGSNDVFQPSPYEQASCVDDAHTLMSHLLCEISLAHFYQLSKVLFGSIDRVKYIEEASLDVQNSKFKVKMILANGQEFVPSDGVAHQVLCVETDAGEAFVVDITGAQYGQRRPVIPLEQALAFYSRDISLLWPHGHYHATNPGTLRQTIAKHGLLARVRVLPAFFASLLAKHMATWTPEQKELASSALSLLKKDYERFKVLVLDTLSNAVLEGTAVYEKQPDIRRLLPLLAVPPAVYERMCKGVVTAIVKDYKGSRTGKQHIEHLMRRAKKENPGKWNRTLGPRVENGGSVTVESFPAVNGQPAYTYMYWDTKRSDEASRSLA